MRWLPSVGQRHLTLLLVQLDVAFGLDDLFGAVAAVLGDDLGLQLVGLLDEIDHYEVDGLVEVRAILQRTGDDERRARLVDEDAIHLVDDGEIVPALDHIVLAHLHVVAEVVEAQLVVGAVGDVAGIRVAALLIVEAVHDDADRQAEEFVDLAHPLAVAFGEVVVDRHHVHAALG